MNPYLQYFINMATLCIVLFILSLFFTTIRKQENPVESPGQTFMSFFSF